MKVNDIAKATGKDKAEVAEAFGIEQKHGYWLNDVDDAEANAYMQSFGVEQPEGEKVKSRPARFWCRSRRNRLPSKDSEARGDIAFENWTVTFEQDSPEAAFMRRPDIRDRLRVYEILPEPYSDPGQQADFILRLESLIFTGQTQADGPSREGRDCVLEMLFPDMAASLKKEQKNSPRALARAVASLIKPNVAVESFGSEG